MVDRVLHREPARTWRRLVVRLALFAFCGGLLLLLSSRPAEAVERREPGLLDPVGTTLKATAREVDSFAGRATGSGASPVGQVADAARQTVAPRTLSAAAAAHSAVGSAVKRGAPAVPSPVRRAAPPTRPATSAIKPVTRPAAKPVARVAKLAAKPVDRVAGRTAPVAQVAAPVAKLTAPVAGAVAPVAAPVLAPVGSALAPVGSALAPVGSALAPVGSALAPVTAPVAGLVPPVVTGGLPLLPGPAGPQDGPAAERPAAVPSAGSTGSEGAGAAPALTVSRTPARPAADGASSPAARSTRSWPALTGAVSLPGFPASAELPAGGPDPLSNSSGGAFTALAALAAALLLLGPLGRGRTRPDRSGVVSRSYLPLVSPA